MDLFEKAHVSKKHSQKKANKSEENVKKQLKQMLEGYKQNDNDIIKSSGIEYSSIVDTHQVLDDSSSVSGFSDLDITVSEEDEENNKTVFSEESENNISSSNDGNLSSCNPTDQLDDTSTENTDKIVNDLIDYGDNDYLEPILEDDEGVDQSLSEDTELDISQLSLLDSVNSSSESLSNDTESGEFDADGLLASQIMKNLEKTGHTKAKKHKLTETRATKSKISKKTPKKNKNKGDLNYKDVNIIEESTHSTQDALISNESSQFVSITATSSQMSNQSLNEVLGDYKYPTVRNIPSEKHNSFTFTNNTGIFSIDNEMQVEDANSLIPEIGEDPTIEDLEMDLNADSDSVPVVENTDVSWIPLPQLDDEDDIMKRAVIAIRVYDTDDACILVLRNPTEFYVNGKVKIKPLGGTVEVFGHILKDEVELYSPNNSFAQCLKTVTVDNEYFGLFSKLTASGLSVKDAENIVTSLGEYGCVIKLSPLIKPKIDFVDNNFSTSLFYKLRIDNNAHRLIDASYKLGCNIYTSKPFRSFQQHPEWEEAVNCGTKYQSRGIVCGGKGLGKSTFIRYFTNRVLHNGPILVLDLDPGQPEFTVAGCISATLVDEPLLGPNYTHLKKPEISYNIGMINTMNNMFRYTSTVAKLIDYCRSKYNYMPWIVNTMGMTNNVGLKFILLAIIRIQPTFLVQIDSKVMKKRFECYLEPDVIRNLYESYKGDRLFKDVFVSEDLDYNFILTKHIGETYKPDTSLATREERYLNFLAYFGELMDKRSSNFLENVPYIVNLSDLNVFTNVKVDKDAILKVINGKIVALCQLDTTDKGNVFTLGDKAPVCHGHGLIRGVEFRTKNLYLVTPMAAEQLCVVNTLIYSDWAPEIQGTELHLPPGTTIPYRGTSTHNQHMRTPHRRFNPLKLLKMSRNT